METKPRGILLNLLLTVALMAGLCFGVSAQKVFSSVTSGDWDEAGTWILGGGTGGIEGISYPGPNDTVYINENDTVYLDLTNNGNDYEFQGYMQIDTTGVFHCGSGSGASDGFVMVDDAYIIVDGNFWIAIDGEGPGTGSPAPRDFDIEDDAYFRVNSGAYIYLADDWFIRDQSFVYLQPDICVEIDDDLQIEDNAYICGSGDASINLSVTNNTLTYANGASAANICSNVSIYRGSGAACSGSGTLVQAGTGPAGFAPIGIADFLTATKNTGTNLDVLDAGTDDYDQDGDTLGINSAGDNAAFNDNNTAQGGTLSINNNGTASNTDDDYIVYTPPTGFTGTDTFKYVLIDEQSLKDTVQVVVFVIECGEYIELLADGANGTATTTLAISDTAEIDSIVVESTYKGTAPASVTFTSTVETKVNSSPVVSTNGSGGVFRSSMQATSSISATTTNTSTTQSFTAYVYRTGTSKQVISVQNYFSVFIHEDTTTHTLNIPSGSTTRNVIVRVPISELNNDGRSAIVKVSYGTTTVSLETFTEDLGNSIKVFTVLLEDVPANTTQLTLDVISVSGQGDSFIVGGALVTIQCGGNAPDAENDFAATTENTAVEVDILANDTDADNNLDVGSLTNLGVLDPQNGTLSAFNATTGKVTYTPDASFTGVDVFEYLLCDSTNVCDIGRVYVTVTCAGGQFVEVASNFNLDLGGVKDGGLTWADFNNDGNIDVLVNTTNTTNDSRLYFADGSGALDFTDVTSTNAAGLLSNNCRRTAIAGDLNNDGYVDFLRNYYNRIEIWYNQGPGSSPAYSFGDASQAANIVITSISGGMNTEGIVFADWNNDGWLDIVMDNDNNGSEVYENDKDGTFTLQTPGTGAGETGFPASLGDNGDYMTVGDYNNDGYPDLVIRKDATNSDGVDIWEYDPTNDRYDDITSPNIQGDGGNKGAVTFCDLDNDGDLDFVWTAGTGTANKIYENQDGTFALESTVLTDGGIDECDCADIDNDGDLDIFFGDDAGNSYLYKNAGGFSFSQDNDCIAPGADVEGAEFVDFDGDGDMDLYMNINNGANQLWMNAQNDLNYIKVRALEDLGGGKSRASIGANIMIHECLGADSLIQEVSGGRGHGSQKPSTVHFGLGTNGNNKAINVIVFFPDSNGTVDTVTQTVVPSRLTDQTLTVYRGDADNEDCTDTDGDGVADLADLDDDNDGILDADESCSEAYNRDTLDWGFRNWSGTSGSFNLQESRVDVTAQWTGTTGTISIDNTEEGGFGGQLALMTDVNAASNSDSIEYFFSFSQDMDTVEFLIWDIDLRTGTSTPELVIIEGYLNGALVLPTSITGSSSNTVVNNTIEGTTVSNFNSSNGNATIKFHTPIDSMRIAQTYGSSSTSDPAQIRWSIYDMTLVQSAGACNDPDSDQDGLIDRLDVDSDGDGIADIVEAGGVDTDGDGVVDGAFADTDGDGYSNTFDSDNGGTPLANPDTDGDGIKDRKDLDSDNDGLTDIIEAGGTDSDNDGKGDSTTDTDGDGFVNTYDTDNSGTNLADTDTDSDGNPNRADIDSDADGIPDNIEIQTTAAYVAPSGVDTDYDGIDDQYDTDCSPCSTITGSVLTATNTDGSDDADYIDTDSDNDGVSDNVEAYDDDYNDVVDTAPSGSDADSDGMDNSYDGDGAGTTNSAGADNDQTPSSFPDTYPTTAERSWREARLDIRSGTGDYSVTSSCPTLSGSSWIDVVDDNDDVVYSINPNGNNLGATCWGVRILSGSGNVRKDTNNSFPEYILNRNFFITPTTQPSTNVSLKFYVLTTEVTDMRTALNDDGFGNGANNQAFLDDSLKVTETRPASINLDPLDNGAVSANQKDPTNHTFTSSGHSLDISIDDLGEFVPGMIPNLPNAALPIRLLDFQVRLIDKDVEITWDVASEQDVQSYIIERSADLVNWKQVDELPAIGSNNEALHYATIDSEPLFGVSYYRLSSADFDGNKFIEGIKSVENGTGFSNAITFYPNPASKVIYVHNSNDDVVEVEMINALGAIVARQKISGNGEHVMHLDLPNGIYQLIATSGKQRISQKIILAR